MIGWKGHKDRFQLLSPISLHFHLWIDTRSGGVSVGPHLLGCPHLLGPVHSATAFLHADSKTSAGPHSSRRLMTSIDMTDTYFHVPTLLHHIKYLWFAVDGKIFQYCCLLFGYSLASHTSKCWGVGRVSLTHQPSGAHLGAECVASFCPAVAPQACHDEVRLQHSGGFED